MKIQRINIITILTMILSIVLSIVSYYGAFIPGTYKRETVSMAVQGTGQDIFDLFFVVPLLLISLFFMHKEKKSTLLIFSGTDLYILYSFIIYSFGVHFNSLFILYCAVLGLSLYTFILILIQLSTMNVKEWFNSKTPRRSVAIFFLIFASMFYIIWLKDIIPAIVSNSIPKSVSQYNLLVNPVHVLDIAIVLPGLIIIAILLLRQNRTGFLFAPIILVFTILMALALLSMVIMLQIRGINEDPSIAAIFIVLTLISGIFLFFFIRSIELS